MIKIDGSYLEGGGQIARTALALSTLTGKPFEVDNIRKGRCDSGLKAQHLYCVRALEELCNAKAEGVKLGSTYLRYFPGRIKGKTISIDIGTAGSISLLLQAVLLPSMFADSKVRLKITGGTDGKWAQPYDYFVKVFLPQIEKFVDGIDVELVKRGYYPKGDGKVDIKISPKYKLIDFMDFNEFYNFLKSDENNNLNYNLIEQGRLKNIYGVSHASKFLEKSEVAERQAKAAKYELTKLNVPVKIKTEYHDTASTGSGIVLWAEYENGRVAGDSLGEQGRRAEIVGKEAAENLMEEIKSGAPVDKYLADQILPFMALTPNSKIKVSKVTNHTKTNIYVVEKFLDVKFELDGDIIKTLSSKMPS